MTIATRFSAFAAILFWLGHAAHGQPSAALVTSTPPAGPALQNASRPSGQLQPKVAPGLARYTDEVLFGEIWPDAGLSPRDRSLVVISALIAMNRPAQLQGHLGRALDNGVTPTEASGVLTHLALYAGWPNAVSALEVYDRVYTAKQVDFVALQSGAALKLSDPSPIARDDLIAPHLASIAPKFAELSDRVVVNDLWRRTDLGVKDRSLVTIAAMTAMGEDDLLMPYIRRGISAGLTREQVVEALTHLAFYAGWGKASKALMVVEQTLPQKTTGAQPKGQIVRSGSAPVRKGSPPNFIGTVNVAAPYQVAGASRVRGSTVTFERGARSAWHRHPLGQTLIVTQGCGWTQIEGGPIEKICAGDVAWVAPGEKHWHGATSASAMTHVTASEIAEDKEVEWLEQVSDNQYARGPK